MIKMKKAFKPLLFLAIATLGFTSCNRDKVMSDEEIFDAVSDDFASLDDGFAGEISDNTEEALAASSGYSENPYVLNYLCGETRQGSFTYDWTNQANNNIWRGRLEWTRTFTCANGVMSEIKTDYTHDFDWDATRSSGEANASGTLVFSQFDSTSTEWNASLSRFRSSTINLKNRRASQVIGSSTLNSSNIKIDKTTKIINSGTADFRWEGSIDGRDNTIRTGTMTFNGNRSVTLTLDNGNSFTWTYN